jgi:hypothetical protein
MGSPTNNSNNLNRTRPTPQITDRTSSSQIITIAPSEDGRVRLRSILFQRRYANEFSDKYLHKPAPTDPIFDIDLVMKIDKIDSISYLSKNGFR